MEEVTANAEQGQNLLVPSEQTGRFISKIRWPRTVYTATAEHYWPILLLLFVIMVGIGVVYIPRLKSDKTEGTMALKQGTSFAQHRHEVHQQHKMQSSFRRLGSPEAMGSITVYIHERPPHVHRKPPQRVYIPTARYRLRRFPLKGPFLNFMLSAPVFAHRSTQETIIYTSTRIYILPALTDAHGKRYSIAELIASGYASFTSNKTQPIGSIDMKAYFQPRPITGPHIPKINTLTGGFSGGVRTRFDSFDIPNNQDLYDKSEESKEEDKGKNNYQQPSYQHSNYHKSRHRDSERSKTTKPSTKKTKKIKKTKKTKSSSTSTSEPLETTISLTPETTSPSTLTNKPRPHPSYGEVNFTLIIDEIFPYPQSQKPVISVNYSFPGPLIDVYENDTVVFRVINRLNIPSTLHWHGVRQLGTPDMDGAVGLSQCAIPPQHEMIYKFQATPAGTTWYHGHLLEQYIDGLFGPLVIRRRNETYRELYDSEQILMIADWYNLPAHTGILPWHYNPKNRFGLPPLPNAIVVNGKFSQSLFIPISGSKRVRFRIVNAAALSMYTVSIDGLPLHVIEVDTTTTKPYVVDLFTINVAQRVSFYIDLNELDSTYTSSRGSSTTSLFIRIQAVVSVYPQDIANYIPPYENQSYPYPTFFNPLYLAILSLDSANSTPTYAASVPTPILSNVTPPVDTNLLDARPLIRNANGIPNATHYLYVLVTFDLGTDGYTHAYINNVTYSSDANYMHMRNDPEEGITSDLYTPLLYQMVEKPDQLAIPSPLLEAGNQLPTIQSDQNGHYLVPYQAVVDILVNNTDSGEHPFHLHGHNFWIIATSDYPAAESLYVGDYIQRDTVSVPATGWAKIRFVADNPGAWFFHCHIEWHMSDGLAIALIVAPDQLLSDGYKIPQSGEKLCQVLRRFNETY